MEEHVDYRKYLEEWDRRYGLRNRTMEEEGDEG